MKLNFHMFGPTYGFGPCLGAVACSPALARAAVRPMPGLQPVEHRRLPRTVRPREHNQTCPARKVIDRKFGESFELYESKALKTHLMHRSSPRPWVSYPA